MWTKPLRYRKRFLKCFEKQNSWQLFLFTLIDKLKHEILDCISLWRWLTFSLECTYLVLPQKAPLSWGSPHSPLNMYLLFLCLWLWKKRKNNEVFNCENTKLKLPVETWSYNLWYKMRSDLKNGNVGTGKVPSPGCKLGKGLLQWCTLQWDERQISLGLKPQL